MFDVSSNYRSAKYTYKTARIPSLPDRADKYIYKTARIPSLPDRAAEYTYKTAGISSSTVMPLQRENFYSRATKKKNAHFWNLKTW